MAKLDFDMEVVVSNSLKTLVRMDLDFDGQTVVLERDHDSVHIASDDKGDPVIRVDGSKELAELETALHHMQLAVEAHEGGDK